MTINLRDLLSDSHTLFWFSLVLLSLYVAPLFLVPALFWGSTRFTEDLFLYAFLLPFLGPRDALLAKVAWLLAPLLGFFSFSATLRAEGPHFFRAAVLASALLFAIIANGVTLSILSTPNNLASLNAHEAGPTLNQLEVAASFERYQETLLTLLVSLIGIKVVLATNK